MALVYKVSLFNVFWNQEGIDNRYFESLSDQEDYFASKIAVVGESDLLNFPFNNNINTTITFIDRTGRDIQTILKCNYCAISKYSKLPDETLSLEGRRYFFISSIIQTNNNQIQAQLDLDDIQSNFIGKENSIAKCRIQRAHINRYSYLQTGSPDCPSYWTIRRYIAASSRHVPHPDEKHRSPPLLLCQ